MFVMWNACMHRCKSFECSDKNYVVVAAVMDSMHLGKPDQSGIRHPEAIPGKEFKMQCSAALLAIGRGPDSFLQKKQVLKWTVTIQLQSMITTRHRWKEFLLQEMLQAEKPL